MSKRDIPAPKSILLPALLVPIMLCLAGAAALTLMSRSAAPVAAPADQVSFVLQRLPFEAQNALRGDLSAFDAMAKSSTRLNNLRAGLTDSAIAGDPAWNTISTDVAMVADARSAVEVI